MESERHPNASLHWAPRLLPIRSPIADGQSPSISDLVPFIDWSPFFHTWELRGRYPAILEKPEARKLFDDAQELLRRHRQPEFAHRARGVWLLPGQRPRR